MTSQDLIIILGGIALLPDLVSELKSGFVFFY